MNRAERAARNESTFREANERIEEKADELSFTKERTPYICECEDTRCTQIIMLTREEYEAVRGDPKTFAIALGHESPDDRVIDETTFTLVEKTGEEGALVEEQNPRS